MYFLNLKGLVNELSTRPLTSREGYGYILGFVVLKGLLTLLNFEGHKAAPPVTPSYFVVMLIGIGFGLTIVWLVLQNLFVSNGGDDGTDFVGNLVAVGFVTSVRLTCVVLPISLIFQFYFRNIDKPDMSAMGASMIVLVVILLGAIWMWLKDTNRALRAIRDNRKAARDTLPVENS